MKSQYIIQSTSNRELGTYRTQTKTRPNDDDLGCHAPRLLGHGTRQSRSCQRSLGHCLGIASTILLQYCLDNCVMDWLKARVVFVPTLLWNMLLGRWLKQRNWWDRIHPNVILGAFPFPSDVARLASEGVKGVVNTCEEYGGPTGEYEKHSITQFRMPTIDFTHPKLDDVCAAVEFIEEQVAQGRTVYIHCKAGRGRSATVAICWLIKSQQITSAEGQRWLSEKRSHVNQHLPSRPVVKEFEKMFLNV